MRKLIVTLLLAGLAACSGNTDTAPAENKTAPAAETPITPAATEPAKEPVPSEPIVEPAKETPAAGNADAKAAIRPAANNDAPPSNRKPGVYVHFQTNMGNFTAELNEKEAPIASANFIGLASGTKEWTDPRSGQKQKKPYYDGLIFHRVIGPQKMPPLGFMIQGGDPLGNGTGGPGFTIKDEYNNLKHDKAGVLSMARTSAPDSAGSQFYITLGPHSFLDGQRPPYVVFGQVIEGLEVVQKIGGVVTDPSDKPVSPVTMTKVTVERVK
jgi:peptidyl-prolyl cis-trans isomerase A (cyclophilin A)